MPGTAFPGIEVNSVTVSQGEKEVTRQFQVPISGMQFKPGKRVRGLEKKVEEKAGLSRRKEIRYNLTVTAVSKASASAKARAFTRMKNVFEPDLVTVVSARSSGPAVVGKHFQVVTEVSK